LFDCCCRSAAERPSILSSVPLPTSTPTNGRGRGVAADVRGYPDVDRPAAGAARAGMTGRWGRRCDRRRRQRCALITKTRRVLGEQSGGLAPNQVDRDRISLRRNLQGRRIRSDGPGIRGMSVESSGVNASCYR
jgi:hypothetical protein